MAISLIPKSRLGALNISASDIGSAGLPVNVLNNNYSGPGGVASNGWYLTWNTQANSWVPTPNPSFSVSYHDAETPSGAQNSVNKIFTLLATPTTSPSSTNTSLQLFVGGQLMTPGSGGDYTISGNTITFTGNGAIPGPNDQLLAYYRA
jgi:hypothetical protein